MKIKSSKEDYRDGMDKSHRNAIGPLVKAQPLYLRSGIEGNKHWDFQMNVNSLIRCHSDEIMRVSLASINVFNSYQQITASNKKIYLHEYAPGQENNPWLDNNVRAVNLTEGTYTLYDLAVMITGALRSAHPQSIVEYRQNSNSFVVSVIGRLAPENHVSIYMEDNLNSILGFSSSQLKNNNTYYSDRAPLPHGVAEIVVELHGLTAIEGAAPVSNYDTQSDDVDFGHVLAVVPAGAIWERTIYNSSNPAFHSFFFSEKSVNTLRISLKNRRGGPHTWIAHPVGVGLLFETFKRA